MPSYSGEGSGGPRHSGYAVIGPPFSCEKTFERVEADWAGGRITATFTGTIIKPLSFPVMSYDGQTEHLVPDKAVGETVRLYLEHPLNNHSVGDDEDSYEWLNTSWSQKGRPFASFWTAWVLARAGFSTKDLSYKDADQLALEIQAALNAGGSWAAPVRDSQLRDFQKPIPPGEECIAVFYSLPYYDWRTRRPTWVKYKTVTPQGQERTVREVVFLLRVVAPERWRGVLLPLRANYTLIHGQLDGNDVWDKTHKNATFDSVLTTLGISAMGLNAFFEDIPSERLFEKGVGEINNVLDYAETALNHAVEMGHQVYVVIPKEGWTNREAVHEATTLNIQRIAGDGFVVPVLKTVKELGPIASEPIPGFGEDEVVGLSTAEVVAFLNARAGDIQVANRDGTFVAPKGVEWMKRYMVPLFQVLGLDRTSPFDGWTTEILDKARLILQDESYLSGCADRNLDDEEALAGIVEYAQNLLIVEEETADAEPATAF